MLGSPLMIGCDIRSMTDETKAILTNRELIAIDQDARHHQAYIRMHDNNEDLPIIVRALENGDLALGFFNMTEGKTFFWIPTDDIGLPTFAHKTFVGKELYTGEDVRTINGTLQWTVEPHNCAVFRLKVVNKE